MDKMPGKLKESDFAKSITNSLFENFKHQLKEEVQNAVESEDYELLQELRSIFDCAVDDMIKNTRDNA